MSYYIDHFVQTRVSKLTYGIESGVDYYDSSNPEHRKRPTYIHWLNRCSTDRWCHTSGFKAKDMTFIITCLEPFVSFFSLILLFFN